MYVQYLFLCIYSMYFICISQKKLTSWIFNKYIFILLVKSRTLSYIQYSQQNNILEKLDFFVYFKKINNHLTSFNCGYFLLHSLWMILKSPRRASISLLVFSESGAILIVSHMTLENSHYFIFSFMVESFF